MTVLELGDSLPASEREFALAALTRAASHLESRWNEEVSNQNLAAALALLALSRASGESRWEAATQRAYARLSEDQSSEGWFPEYGGVDFGYSTLSLDLLAAADRLDAGDLALPLATRLVSFLTASWGKGPTYPGRLGSRGTGHLFCFGAEHFADSVAGAAGLAQAWRNSLDSGSAPRPQDVDDRYLCYFYFNAWALAAVSARRDLPVGTLDDSSHQILPEAGLSIWRFSGWSVTESKHLGRAIAVEVSDMPPAYNLGYEIETADGGLLSTAFWNVSGDDQAVNFTPIYTSRPLDRWDWLFPPLDPTSCSSRTRSTFSSMGQSAGGHPTARDTIFIEAPNSRGRVGYGDRGHVDCRSGSTRHITPFGPLSRSPRTALRPDSIEPAQYLSCLSLKVIRR